MKGREKEHIGEQGQWGLQGDVREDNEGEREGWMQREREGEGLVVGVSWERVNVKGEDLEHWKR